MKAGAGCRQLAAAFRNRRVLITGGLGFVGSNLAQALVREAGARVTLVDAMVHDCGANLHNIDGIEQDVELRIGNIGDSDLMAALVRGVEVVFNLAASISHINSMTDPQADCHYNCGEHLAFLEICRRVNPGVRLVLASTRQVYGRPRRLPVPETHPVCPVDLNGVHKLAREQYHLLYRRLCGMRVTILRLTNTYGPRQLLRHPRQGFVGWFINRALKGQCLDLYDGGEQLRDFTFVEDALEALLLAGSRDCAVGQVYNLGGERPYSLREFAGVLADLVPGTVWREKSFPAERKAIDIGSYWADCTRIREELGWVPRVSLRDGLERTLAFYRQHRQWYLPDEDAWGAVEDRMNARRMV